MKSNFLRPYSEKLATVPKNSSLYIACLHTIVEYSAFWDEVKIIYVHQISPNFLLQSIHWFEVNKVKKYGVKVF